MINDPVTYAAPIGAVAAGLTAGGETGRVEALRARLDQAWAARPPSRVVERFGHAAAMTEDDWWQAFDIAGEAMRLRWHLNANEIVVAEQRAQETLARIPTASAIAGQMAGYYLSTGDWQHADVWRKAELATLTARAKRKSFSTDGIEQRYQASLADAAIRRGDVVVARDAVGQMAAAACSLARKSPYLRSHWVEALRRAYIVKTMERAKPWFSQY